MSKRSERPNKTYPDAWTETRIIVPGPPPLWYTILIEKVVPIKITHNFSQFSSCEVVRTSPYSPCPSRSLQ